MAKKLMIGAFMLLTACNSNYPEDFCLSAVDGIPGDVNFNKQKHQIFNDCLDKTEKAAKSAAYKAAEPYRNIPR